MIWTRVTMTTMATMTRKRALLAIVVELVGIALAIVGIWQLVGLAVSLVVLGIALVVVAQGIEGSAPQ